MRNCRFWSVFSDFVRFFAPAALFFVSLSSLAVVNLEVTRVVFNGDDRTLSLTLANSDLQPTLVQVWTDNGDPLLAPDKVITPMVAIPPVFSMAPGEMRSIKLLLTSRQALSSNKESLLWLNIFQIPPQTQQDRQAPQKVLLPMRIRLKVFIRPQGINAPIESDGHKLSFTLQQDEPPKLIVHNPTPWHMTLSDITCGHYTAETSMVPPQSSQPIMLNGSKGTCKTLQYNLINDSGNRWQYSINL